MSFGAAVGLGLGQLERRSRVVDHKVGTREEWQAARDELAKLEAEHAERNKEITRRRRELPRVRHTAAKV